MSEPPSGTLTAASFLFGSPEDSKEALRRALDQDDIISSRSGALENLASASRRAVVKELAEVTADLVGLNIIDIVAMAWRKYSALLVAAQRTLEAPLSDEVVELVNHRITSTHQPYVDVLIDDFLIATVHFELVVEFVAKGLVATVRMGRIVDLHGGDCRLGVTLAAEGVQVANREASLELPVVINLGDGISLLQEPIVLPETHNLGASE